MAKGVFPTLLKIAQITPIPKITSKSILPTLSTIFEKLIYL